MHLFVGHYVTFLLLKFLLWDDDNSCSDCKRCSLGTFASCLDVSCKSHVFSDFLSRFFVLYFYRNLLRSTEVVVEILSPLPTIQIAL